MVPRPTDSTLSAVSCNQPYSSGHKKTRNGHKNRGKRLSRVGRAVFALGLGSIWLDSVLRGRQYLHRNILKLMAITAWILRT